MRHRLFILALSLTAAFVAGAARADTYEEQRLRLVDELERQGRRWGDADGSGGFDPAVLDAMARVPRHLYVPEAYRKYAYENRPLPIGHGQTISQPYIVALMTDLLDLAPGMTAFEVGTGSGYQAAVLAALGVRVYTVEIVEPLAEAAAARFERLGVENVISKWADGYDGWPVFSPFDAVIVTAAASHIPPPLVAQLKPGGRMIIPVGAKFMTQYLVLVEKDAAGRVTTRQVLPVVFVPLTRME